MDNHKQTIKPEPGDVVFSILIGGRHHRADPGKRSIQAAFLGLTFRLNRVRIAVKPLPRRLEMHTL